MTHSHARRQGVKGQNQALLSDMPSKAGAIESHVTLGLYSIPLQEQGGRPSLSLFISQFPLKMLSPHVGFVGNQTAIQSVLS